MNRILYLFIGACVAGVIVTTFFSRIDIARLSTTDIEVTGSFGVAMAVAAIFLIHARRGRSLRSRLDKHQAEVDEREREQARTEGKVRRPRMTFWF